MPVLPASGAISMRSIREIMNHTGPISLSTTIAGTGGKGAYSDLNPKSPVVPSATSPFEITDWRGYAHGFSCTVNITYNANDTTSASITFMNWGGFTNLRILGSPSWIGGGPFELYNQSFTPERESTLSIGNVGGDWNDGSNPTSNTAYEFIFQGRFGSVDNVNINFNTVTFNSPLRVEGAGSDSKTFDPNTYTI